MKLLELHAFICRLQMRNFSKKISNLRIASCDWITIEITPQYHFEGKVNCFLYNSWVWKKEFHIITNEKCSPDYYSCNNISSRPVIIQSHKFSESITCTFYSFRSRFWYKGNSFTLWFSCIVSVHDMKVIFSMTMIIDS